MVKRKKHLGLGFSDEVTKASDKANILKRIIEYEWKDSLIPNFDPHFGKEIVRSPWRITSLFIICIILFFIIFVRIFHLQIVEGKINRELADGNRIQIKIIHAPRGVIFDRNGKILASNSPAFRLLDPKTKKVRLISREQALELEVKNDPKVSELEIDHVRTYPLGETLAHVIGYVGEVSEEELKTEEFKNYKLGDRIGKMGIEAQYEKILRGVDGGEIIEVDSSGKTVRTLRKNVPIPGQNVYITIDSELQEKIYQLTKDAISKVDSCCGVAVAMDPQSGQVLALLSFPTFDPNIFTNVENEGVISETLTNPSSPILNRVIGGTYPPGSTFKIVSALAGLTSGKFGEHTTIQDNGVMYIGPFKFTNWYFNQYGKTEGPVDLIKAIKRSNDTYFYNVGQAVGEKVLAQWAKKLNLGEILGIDLPGELRGLIPDNDWKMENYGLPWYPGDTLHMAIGQGFVLTTPLQILGITSYIASDGTIYKPHLLQKITKDTKDSFVFKSQAIHSNLADPKWVKLIKKGLEEVTKQGGTAWPFFIFPIPTAGKTGTAEYGDPKDRTHAWYTSYAPAENPRIVLTILIEGGGEGSSVAAPVAKEVYRWYLSEDKNNLIKDVYTKATDSGKILGE